MVFCPIVQAQFREVDDLNETEKSNSKKKGEQIKIEECMFSDDD